MEKLSFSEMEEVQGGSNPLGLWYAACGVIHGAIAAAQSKNDTDAFIDAVAFSESFSCQILGF